jgi:predicted MPP superfamily phosphohydrolase
LKAPQYFVYGNHDQEVDENEVVKRMKKVGVIVLQNELTNFGELQIIGLNNMPIDEKTADKHSKHGKENMEDVLNKLPMNESKPTILLHHRPEGIEYAALHKIDLMLAGHTHGGQLFPISLISQKLYKYNKGLYQFQNLTIYVSEGLGTIFTPVRFGTNSDLTIINLVQKHNFMNADAGRFDASI